MVKKTEEKIYKAPYTRSNHPWFTGYPVKARCGCLGWWYVCVLHRRFSCCSLLRVRDGRIMRCGTFNSCQSAAAWKHFLTHESKNTGSLPSLQPISVRLCDLAVLLCVTGTILLRRVSIGAKTNGLSVEKCIFSS